ncbi:hypothetical protein [Nocardioides limicola]|uniref:hypothetical protein n=1 Tax=Nocardioides limicola TaxID=2803368 RepID=UPI00193B744D|nr:hypothetical protein [Nocardioides sp. DJM-14]
MTTIGLRIRGALAVAVLLGAAAGCGDDGAIDPSDETIAPTPLPEDTPAPDGEADEAEAGSRYADLDEANQEFMDLLCEDAQDPDTVVWGDFALPFNMVISGERGVPELDEVWRELAPVDPNGNFRNPDADDRVAMLAAARLVCEDIGWTPGP